MVKLKVICTEKSKNYEILHFNKNMVPKIFLMIYPNTQKYYLQRHLMKKFSR